MCSAPAPLSYASKQDAFGNQSAHPSFINHLSASAKIPPPPSPQCVCFSRLHCFVQDVFFLQHGGRGGGMPGCGGYFMSWLCRRCHSPTWCLCHRLVSLLACCARQTSSSDENGVCSSRCDASCCRGLNKEEKKSICCGLKASKSGNPLKAPQTFSDCGLSRSLSFIPGYTAHCHIQVNTSSGSEKKTFIVRLTVRRTRSVFLD